MSHASDSGASDGVHFEEESSDDVFDMSITKSLEKMDSHYFSNVLTDLDLEMIHPEKYRFIKQLRSFVSRRNEILFDFSLDEGTREKKLNGLMFITEAGHQCKLEDLGYERFFDYILAIICT